MDNMTSLESFIDFCENMQIEDMDIAKESSLNKTMKKGVSEAEAVKLFEKYINKNKKVFTKAQLNSEAGMSVREDIKRIKREHNGDKQSKVRIKEIKNTDYVLLSYIDKESKLCESIAYWKISKTLPNEPLLYQFTIAK